MLGWINPRVVAVVASVMLLLAVTHSVGFEVLTHRAIWVCVCLFVLYVLVFLGPLRQAVRWPELLGMTGMLAAAWAAIALAMIADARPISLEDQMQHPTNWSRDAFVVAAGVAFFLFFRTATRGYSARDELITMGVIKGGRRG